MKSRTLDPERQTKPVREPLNTEGFALPKPGPRVKAQPKDGRKIEYSARYCQTKRRIWEEQKRKCFDCKKFLPSPAWGHRHHLHGRGLGGSKRSDKREDSVLLCFSCHRSAHPGPQWSKRSAE